MRLFDFLSFPRAGTGVCNRNITWLKTTEISIWFARKSALCVISLWFYFQERYRNDCNLAVQLLQCKPADFVAQKLCDVSHIKTLACFFMTLAFGGTLNTNTTMLGKFYDFFVIC